MGQARLSVFHFDALQKWLLSDIPDPAWAAWLVAQENAAFSMSCAVSVLMCASPELCGDCEACTSQGIAIGNASRAHVAATVLLALVERVASGPAQLEDRTGASLLSIIQRAADVLGVQALNPAFYAQSCATRNYENFQLFTNSGNGGRRRLDASTPAPHSAPAGAALPGGMLTAPTTLAVNFCSKLQPLGGSCNNRLSFILERLSFLRTPPMALAQVLWPVPRAMLGGAMSLRASG